MIFDRSLLIVCFVTGLASASLVAPPALGQERPIDLAIDADSLRIQSRAGWDNFGGAMAVCDLNGDGIEDFLTEDNDASGGGIRTVSGELYVFYGQFRAWHGPLLVADAADVIVYGEEAYDSIASFACGDVTGDGYPDLVICAPNADGPNNSRDSAGQAHIVFGSASLPSIIDLAEDPGTIVYGDGFTSLQDKGHLCNNPSVADLNGDGILDVILDDTDAPDSSGTDVKAGRVYVLFGRPDWPETIDLRANEADITIYGGGVWDIIHAVSGDLDGDGTDELIVTAQGGDGPGEIRDGAGDAYVFRGKAVWPSEIDLAIDQGDVFIYGAELFDSIRAFSPGDLDADGIPEILLASRHGDGPKNEDDKKGEVRLYELGPPPWPDLVDLADSTDYVSYGRDARDYFGNRVQAGDVDGNGSDDLVVTADDASGLDNARRDCGEVYKLTGGPGFPTVIDLEQEDAEFVIYGAEEYDFLTALALPDINGDGLHEVAVWHSSNSSELGSVWLVSPYDVDGDGITQLPDNCPLVANADQLDSDGDLRGDACATDWDGDGLDDGDDCAPANAAGGPPGLVSGLLFEPDSKETLSWNTATFADLYDISRGSLADLDGADFGACQNDRDADRADTAFTDADQPAPGHGYHYLVRARNAVCDLPGSWGPDSSETDRENTNPLTCP